MRFIFYPKFFKVIFIPFVVIKRILSYLNKSNKNNEINPNNFNEYEEKQIESFKPDWKEGLIGLHTFNHDHGCTVIDTRQKRNRFN